MCTKQFAGLLAVAMLALASISCASEAEDIPGNSRGPTATGCDAGAADENETWTVDEAKQFCKFQLYWLGEEYEGLPLTKIERYRTVALPTRVPSYEAEDVVLFNYGSCHAEPDSSCSLPVSLRVEPYCSRPPTIREKSVQGRIVPDFRGVQGLIGDGSVAFWTGNVSVTVFDSRPSGERDAVHTAKQLAVLSDSGPRAGDPLPPVNVACASTPPTGR